jgi:hypothetical protein
MMTDPCSSWLKNLGIAAAATVAGLWAAPAQAYPQWQLSSGVGRCNQCHLAPAGGGPLTSYGRDAVGEDLSTFNGNGAFLHGALALPSRIVVGGDLRGALLAKDVQDPAGAKLAAFPMQADLDVWVTLWAGLSVYLNGGFRGQVRSPDSVVPAQNFQPIDESRYITREHYVSWQRERLGPYVRAGRFYAPFGLRLSEHITYIRRDLGFNLLEESYNLSGGFVQNAWELHVTAFGADVLRHIGSHETGGAAYYERRFLDDTLAVAVQSKVAWGLGSNRVIGGGVAKYYLAPLRTLFLAEGDLVRRTFDGDQVAARYQFVGAAGFALLPLRGLMATFLAERNQGDLKVRDTAVNALTSLFSWFPYAHFELQVVGQLQFPAAGQTAKTVLTQLHYFL